MKKRIVKLGLLQGIKRLCVTWRKKFVLLACIIGAPLQAQNLELNVGQAKIAQKRIAVVPFAGDSSNEKIDFITSVDLKQSGLFLPVAPSDYSERPTSSKTIPFAKFREMNVPYLVFGELTRSDSGQVARFALMDNYQEKVLGSYTIPVVAGNVRFAAHEISDVILQKMTGVRGDFATRLVYVHESGKGKARRYKIMLSDVDGYQGKELISSVAPLMSPRFSPNNDEIAYVSFEGNKSQIVRQNIKNGFRQLVVAESGMNASPAWSPDGKKMAMTLSKDGNPEVYFKDLSTGTLTRVTKNNAIDTEPVWSQDGQSLFFTSDRDGAPQLYQINLSSGKLVKMTGDGSYSAGADVSHNDKRIAFSRRESGRFAVGTADIGQNNFRRVSEGFLDETPRFSPNGQRLIYTSIKEGRQVLKLVNVDGSGEVVLSGGGHIRDADWSSHTK